MAVSKIRCSPTKISVLFLIIVGSLFLWFDEETATKLVSRINVSREYFVSNINNNTINITKILIKEKQIEQQFNETLAKNKQLTQLLNAASTKNKNIEQELLNKSLELKAIKAIKAKYSASYSQVMDTQNIIDRSKWSNCFISNANESIISLTYSDQQYGDSMNILVEKYLKTNILKIFVIHYRRHPNLYGYKCGIPMNAWHVGQKYYYVNNRFYHRIHNKDTCIHEDFCVFYDFYALFTHIYDTYKNDSITKWALIFEDDVSLCPRWINATLNLLDQAWLYEKYNYTDSMSMDFVYYGHGATGTFVRISFIEVIIRILDTYEERQIRLMKKNNWHNSMDRYIPTWCKKWAYGHCVSSLNNLLFHPSSKRKNSTFPSHKYTANAICDASSTWSGMGMKGYILSGDHEQGKKGPRFTPLPPKKRKN